MPGRSSRVKVYFDGDTTGLTRATRSAEQGVSRLTQSYRQQVRSLGSANASYQQAARHMGITAKEARALASANTRLSSTTQQAGGHMRTLDTHTRTLSTSLKSAAKAGLAAGAAYIGIAQAKSAIDATTDLAKVTLSLTENMGFASKTAIELGTQLKVRGTDAKQSAQAFATFSGVLHGAATGSQSAIDKLAELGITGKKLRQDLNDPQRALFDVTDGLKKLGEGASRTDEQRKLFGRGWQALSPILRDGSAALKQNLKDAQPVFDAFGGGGVKSMKEFLHQQRLVQIQMLALQVTFTKNVAPSLIVLFKAFGDVTKAVHDFFHATNQMGPTFGEAAKWVVNAVGNIKDSFNSLPGVAKRAFKDLGQFIIAPFADAYQKVTGFIHGIISVLNLIPGVNIGGGGGGGDTSTAGTGQQGRPHKGGKGTQRRASGGKVTAPMAIVGEEAPQHPEFVLATNPRYRRRNVKLWMQAAKEMGIPGFGLGGELKGLVGGIDPASIIGKFPGVGSLPDWLHGMGSYMLGKAGDYAKHAIGGIIGSVFGGGSAGSPTARIEQVGHALQSQGFSISGERAFGGTPSSGHVAGSLHYSNRAIDVNRDGGPASEPTYLRPLFDQLARGTGPYHPTELFYQNRGIPGPVANHYDHLHLGYAQGGKISANSPAQPKVGNQWIKNVGGHWDPSEIYTALRQLGAPNDMAGFLSAVSVGESAGDPHAIGHDPGGSTGLGLLQMTTGSGASWASARARIARFGGNQAMLNPWQNMLAAMDLYRAGGPGNWYGHKGTAGHLLLDRITAKTKAPAGKAPKGGGKHPGLPPGAVVGHGPESHLHGYSTDPYAALGIAPPAADTGTGDDTANQILQTQQEIRDLLAQQTLIAQQTVTLLNTQGPSLLAAFGAVLSGQIGGNIGLGFSSPSWAGGMARY